MSRNTVLIILMVLGISSIVACYHLSRAKATEIIWKEGHITADETWVYIPDTIYRLIDTVYVDPGVTLTIEPRVEVQFADGFSLIVEGSLNASGTESNPIIFTSSRSSPSPGVWNRIRFKGSSNEEFLVKHVNVEYAVHGLNIEGQGLSKIENSELANCSESGILLLGLGNVVIRDNVIKDNKNGILADASENQSGFVITGNIILSNRENGIYIKSITGWDGAGYIYNITISSNVILSNDKKGIYVSCSGYLFGRLFSVFISSNNVSFNGGDGIHLFSHGKLSGASTYLHDVILSSNVVSSNGGEGITLFTHSVSSHLCNVSLWSNTVSSNGGNGIYFKNGHLGGVAYLYNVSLWSNTVSSNGGNGIYFKNGGDYNTDEAYLYDVTLSFNTVSLNGGDGIHLYSIAPWGSDPSYLYGVFVKSNEVSFNKESGIYLRGYSHKTELIYDVTILASTILENGHKGIWIDGRVNSYLGNNSISKNLYGVLYSETQDNLAEYNDIYENTYGMNVTDSATVNAENNYWGHPSGPFHVSLNPEGQGNPTNGDGIDLDFIPFVIPEFSSMLILPLFMVATFLIIVLSKCKNRCIRKKMGT